MFLCLAVLPQLAHLSWSCAMKDEMHALIQNQTWQLISLPIDKKPIGCHWVFTITIHPDDTLDRLKTWLVVKRYIQTYGVNYDDTFSPVAKTPFVHVLISLAA